MSRFVKVNRLPGVCGDCGKPVKKFDGKVRRSDDGKRWLVRHDGCNWQHGSPESAKRNPR